jgi:uncharacterized protein
VDTLKQKISKDYVDAFKAGDKVKKNLLGVIKAEITTQEKNVNIENLSDADVTKILNKVAKNLKETISQSQSEEAKLELTIVEAYLPKQMSEEEIRTAVGQIIADTGASTPGEMGKVMGGFNAKYAGQADGKLVSTIVKELLLTKV